MKGVIVSNKTTAPIDQKVYSFCIERANFESQIQRIKKKERSRAEHAPLFLSNKMYGKWTYYSTPAKRL